MIKDKTIIYNTSEDDWTHAEESLEEVLLQLVSDMEVSEILDSSSLTLYKGVVNKVDFSRYVNVSSILDSISEWAYDDHEFAEGYLDDVTEEQKDDLERVICDWAKLHNIEPKFFEVGEVEELIVELTDDLKKELLNE
tara:strand:+ start:20920 stop:21333 length:414 start_codon:yes stop_codon:yes gene_type:complete